MARPLAMPDISFLTVRGAAREMGRQQGEQWREAIAELCEARLSSTLAWAESKQRSLQRAELLDFLTAFCDAQEQFAPAVHDEFLGIAEGAGLSPELLMAGNGYTDIRDAVVQQASLEGCTTFTVLESATADRAVWLGQTWDMNASMLPFVYVLRREPDDGPATLGLTTTGCLSLIGVNESGVAIGNSNITPNDARPGVMYLALIHHALAQRSLPAAAAVITSAERASGHHYYLADQAAAIHLETTATQWAELARDGACHTQSNDYRHGGFGDLPQPPMPEGRSVERRCALGEALAARQPLDLAGLQAALQTDGVRVAEPIQDVLSCAAVILRPASGEMWVTHGPPDDGLWQAFGL